MYYVTGATVSLYIDGINTVHIFYIYLNGSWVLDIIIPWVYLHVLFFCAVHLWLFTVAIAGLVISNN